MTRISLPGEAWPASDRALWDWLIAPGEILDGAGPLAHLRPASLTALHVSYARWLGWVARAEPDALSVEPILRATPPRMRAWISDRANELSSASRLADFGRLMRVVTAARPDLDWSAQKRQLALLRWEARHAVSDRKSGRLVSSACLLQTGLDLFARGATGSTGKQLQRAQWRRDGVMIACLSVLPLRRGSFTALELGKSISRLGASFRISLDPETTKTGNIWEARVPDPVAGPLREYVDHVRPWFLARGGQDHDFLWVGDRGQPVSAGHFSARISRLTGQLLGIRISPHLFRDCAATTLARDAPESARLIRALLGHTGFDIATRHYNHARMVEDSRDYAALLERTRSPQS